MTKSKPVDISSLIDTPKEENIEQESSGKSIPNTDEDLIKELTNSDPILGMLVARIFDFGRALSEMNARIDILDKYVGHLMLKDDDFSNKIKEVTEGLEEKEGNNDLKE